MSPDFVRKYIFIRKADVRRKKKTLFLINIAQLLLLQMQNHWSAD